MNEWLNIGKIVGAQGLKGEVRIYPDSDFPERFLEPGERWIQKNAHDEPSSIHLTQGRYIESKNLYIVKIRGIDSREHAESVRGCQILVKASDRPHLEPGEYYLMDLIDLEVYDASSQAHLGTVKQIASAGNDLLEIQLTDAAQTRILVPFVTDFFPVVDLENNRLELLPVPGLLPQ